MTLQSVTPVSDIAELDVAAFNEALAQYSRFQRGEASRANHVQINFAKDGVHFEKVHFAFPITLASRRLPFGLHFHNCVFEEMVDVRWAHIDFLSFDGCTLKSVLRGESLVMAGSIDFSGVISESQIDLESARIQGDLILSSAQLLYRADKAAKATSARTGAALFCEGIRVHSILMTRARTVGRIFLNSARLTGILKAFGAEFRRTGEGISAQHTRWENVVLSATDSEIAGAVYLGDDSRWRVDSAPPTFLACGQVDFSNSKIGGDFVCTGGQFHSAYYRCSRAALLPFIDDGQDTLHLAALNVARARIEGSVRLDHGFQAYGEVRFENVTVRGSFRCVDGEFNGGLPNCEWNFSAPHPFTAALTLDRIDVGSNLLLGKGFRAFGSVSLRNAIIRGDVACMGGTFHACWNENGELPLNKEAKRQPEALTLSGAEVYGSIFLVGSNNKPQAPFQSYGQIRLRGTRVRRNLHLGGGKFDLMPKTPSNDDELPLIGWFHSAKITGTIFLTEADRPPAYFGGSVSFAQVEAGCWEDCIECWPQCRAGGQKKTCDI